MLDFERGDDVYRLMDILREARTPVEAIDRTVIDFEEVFRRVVSGRTPVPAREEPLRVIY